MERFIKSGPIRRITLRHVFGKARFYNERGIHYPACPVGKHAAWPHWNVRYDYANSFSVRSMYWCDEHLPAQYRETADSMLRGGEQERIIFGAADPAAAAPAPAPRREPGSRIPWRNLL